MKGILLAAVCVAVVLTAAISGCTDEETGPEVTASFDEEYRANEKTTLNVENPDGLISITGGKGSGIVVTAVKRTRQGEDELDKVEITGLKSGNKLTIRAAWISVLPPRVTVDMDITVPTYVTVESVRLSNGDVRISGTKGDTAVSCFNGDVLFSGVDGYVAAEVTDGTIEVRDTEGIGDLKVKNGRIEAEVYDVRGDVVIELANGDAVVSIDPSLNAAVVLKTANGVVSVGDLPLHFTKETGREAEGVLGTGGPTSMITTTNGDVNVDSL